MTRDEMRQLLANRFLAVLIASAPDRVAYDWDALADECIRQMEWARRQIGDSHYGATPDDREYLNEATPLTLAPEDWKP